MARQPVIALVYPYRKREDDHEFAIFNRADCEEDFWQAISGGAENDETPLDAAIREMWEEGRIEPDARITRLDSTDTIPASNRKNSGWGDDVYVIRKHNFGVDVGTHEIVLSEEHSEYRWVPYENASAMLKLQADRFTLKELSLRIQRGDI